MKKSISSYSSSIKMTTTKAASPTSQTKAEMSKLIEILDPMDWKFPTYNKSVGHQSVCDVAVVVFSLFPVKFLEFVIANTVPY